MDVCHRHWCSWMSVWELEARASLVTWPDKPDLDIAASEEIAELYYGDDPTEGYQTQNRMLFTDQKAATFSLTVRGTEISVSQAPRELSGAGVTGCVVWDGAVVLARSLSWWCERQLMSVAGCRVLELGAGAGVLSVACAALGAQVLATERADRLDLLRQNVAKHGVRVLGASSMWRVGSRGGTVAVSELDWFHANETLPCDLIVASDVVYTEEVTEAFVRCLEAYSVPAIITVMLRTEQVHYDFVERLATSGFTVHRLPTELHVEEVRTKLVVTYILRTSRASAS